jgi:hypothetical protein
LAVFLLIATPTLYWNLGQKQIGAVLLLCAALYVLSLTLPRLTNTIRLTSIAVVTGSVMALLVLILLFYPERAVFYVWFPFIILLTTFGLGRRWGAVLVGMLMPVVWQIELLQINGVTLSSRVLGNPYSLALSFSLAVFMTGVVVNYIGSNFERYPG